MTAPAFGPGMRLLGAAYASLGRRDDAERAARRADRMPGYDPYVDPTFVLLARESRSPTFLLQQAAAADAGTNGAWREYPIPPRAGTRSEQHRRAGGVGHSVESASEVRGGTGRPPPARATCSRRYSPGWRHRPLPVRLEALRRGRGSIAPRPRRVGRCQQPLRFLGPSSIALAGWPKQWPNTGARWPTTRRTATRSTTSGSPTLGPAAWIPGGCPVRAPDRRRSRPNLTRTPISADAVVDGSPRASGARVPGRARDRPRQHRRTGGAGENQFSEDVRGSGP